MSLNEVNDFLNELPEAIRSLYATNEPNKNIILYKGDYLIRVNQNEIVITGMIYYSWFPKLGVKFDGIIKQGKSDINVFQPDPLLELFINNKHLGFGYILQKSGANLSGELNRDVFSGDKSILVSEIHFELLNVRDFNGDSVKRGTKMYNGRLTFTTGRYNITIDKNSEFEHVNETLKATGGYAILYSGELTSSKNSISFSKAEQLLDYFSWFISFLNGKRSWATLREGLYEEKQKWIDYTAYTTDQYRYVKSWAPAFDISDIIQLWDPFYTLMLNEDKRDCITTVIHWYIEANKYSGAVEGSIVLIQNSLELLFNWLIVENLHIIQGSDAINLDASNKIRLLLSLIKIGNPVPNTLTELLQYSKKNNFDGPEAFTQIRNSIVHSNADKRNKLRNIKIETRQEVLQLGIFYVELSLLYILNYKGKYFNRCLGTQWRGNDEEDVPWNRKIS